MNIWSFLISSIYYNFPFIIDTPLASCDDEYRLSIMTLFANLTSDLTNSHATFLFTPSEYDKNVIEFITIATGGEAQDFGDQHNSTQYAHASCSDSHGGLGGY